MYFQDGEDHQPALNDVLINLATQLLRQQPSDNVGAEWKDMYNAWWRTRIFPDATSYEKIVRSEMSKFRVVYIVIDALDNYSDKRQRNALLEFIKRLPGNCKVLVTSRTGWLPIRKFGAQYQMEVIPNKSDIDTYVENRIQNDESLRLAISEESCQTFRESISDSISMVSKGM